MNPFLGATQVKGFMSWTWQTTSQYDEFDDVGDPKHIYPKQFYNYEVKVPIAEIIAWICMS